MHLSWKLPITFCQKETPWMSLWSFNLRRNLIKAFISLWCITKSGMSHTKRLKMKGCIPSCLLVTASFVCWVITLAPIEIQTCSAPQNDCLNLVFVKDIKVIPKKMARNGRKTEFSFCESANSGKKINYVLCHNFWTNWGTDPFSTSKWPSELLVCKRYLCKWQSFLLLSLR